MSIQYCYDEEYMIALWNRSTGEIILKLFAGKTILRRRNYYLISYGSEYGMFYVFIPPYPPYIKSTLHRSILCTGMQIHRIQVWNLNSNVMKNLKKNVWNEANMKIMASYKGFSPPPTPFSVQCLMFITILFTNFCENMI